MGEILKGKAAIVTGSTSGIGEAIARAFACEGAAVLISGRRKDEGERVVASINDSGGTAVFQQADLQSPEDCKSLIAAADETFGGFDILVNNAGIFPRHKFEDITVSDWDQLFNLNVRAAFLCSQAAVEPMQKRGGGSIINIGSCAPFVAAHHNNLFAYACSKGALYMMGRQLAPILSRKLIRVNWITVGWVITEKEIEIQRKEGRDLEALAGWETRQPMKSFTRVEDVAEGCIYLASDAARHVTGSDLNITAGICLHI